jgi:hypothetical protein
MAPSLNILRTNIASLLLESLREISRPVHVVQDTATASALVEYGTIVLLLIYGYLWVPEDFQSLFNSGINGMFINFLLISLSN